MITLEELKIGYWQKRGKDLSLTAPLSFTATAGEMVGIVGPNGVGKSTLLRTLARQQEALGGAVWLQGKELESWSRQEFARLCSFVPAGHLPVNRLTVRETVAMARYPYTGWQGRLSRRDEEAVLSALEGLRLLALKDKQVGEISDGERQRTLIARALAQETPLVLLDEPTAFLDIPNRYEVLQRMGDISKQEGKLFIFSSHDLEFLLETADKIWLIYPDQAYEGSPEDLLKEDLFGPLFRNTGIRYEIGKGLHIPRPAGEATVTLAGDPVPLPWVEKALARAGYTVIRTKEKGTGWHIRAEKEKIFLENEIRDTKKGFSSIYSLILYMKKHFPENASAS